MDIFEFFLNGLKGASREKMLEWFEKSPDLEELTNLSDDELRLVYVERHTLSVMSQSSKNQSNE